ncbi:hypothetical protein NL317_30195, partial [Klebsiella pneumoniae]|nr:hypothetical protein [Klebsiella pneumoniae]
DSRAELAASARLAAEAGDVVAIRIGDILDSLQADRSIVIQAESANDAELSSMRSRIDRWIATEEQLSKWAAYKGRATDATEAGV